MKKKLNCNVHVVSYLNNKTRSYDEMPQAGALELPPGKYTFKYDYPLSREARFKRSLSSKHTARNILRFAARDYKKIYDAEDSSGGDPGYIPGMMNRSASNGDYGIWGHYMGDLYFESIEIDTDKKEIYFGMGS